MMRILHRLLTAALFIAVMPGTAHADQMIAVAQIRPLVEWVESHTNLMLLPRPRIFVSSDAMLRVTVGGGRGQVSRERIAAYHDGVIFINERYWLPGDTADESVLVHELVHYAQDVGGQTYACAGQREEQAYRLQNLYLTEHGERPYVDRAMLERLKSCQQG